MSKLFLLSTLVFATACGSKADNALKEMEGFKNKMCECKDKACVDGVQKDMMEWSKKMKDGDMKKDDLSEDQKKKAGEITAEMMKCAMAAK